jgi:hypothetical protein
MTLPDATFDVYFATDDQIIECTATDPHAGDPADWPSWTDADRWELDLVEPSQEDSAWAAEHLELPAPISGGAPDDD